MRGSVYNPFNLGISVGDDFLTKCAEYNSYKYLKSVQIIQKSVI